MSFFKNIIYLASKAASKTPEVIKTIATETNHYLEELVEEDRKTNQSKSKSSHHTSNLRAALERSAREQEQNPTKLPLVGSLKNAHTNQASLKNTHHTSNFDTVIERFENEYKQKATQRPLVSSPEEMSQKAKLKKEKDNFSNRYNFLSEYEKSELIELVSFAKDNHVNTSWELTNLITKYKLGKRFPNLTGDLKMKNEHTDWTYRNALSPRIYKIICDELNLNNKGTSSKVVSFRKNKDC